MKIFALLLLIVIVDGNDNFFEEYIFPVTDTDPNCFAVLFNMESALGEAYIKFCENFARLVKTYKCCLPLICEYYIKIRKPGDKFHKATMPNIGKPGYTCIKYMKDIERFLNDLTALKKEWLENKDCLPRGIESAVNECIDEFRKVKFSVFQKKKHAHVHD